MFLYFCPQQQQHYQQHFIFVMLRLKPPSVLEKKYCMNISSKTKFEKVKTLVIFVNRDEKGYF